MVHICQDGTFLTLLFYFLGHGDREIIAIDTLQHSLNLLAVAIEHLYILADEIHILLRNLKGLSESCRSYLKLIILLVTVKTVLNISAKLYAVLYPHAVGMVNLYNNSVIRADFYIYKEILLVLQPLLN